MRCLLFCLGVGVSSALCANPHSPQVRHGEVSFAATEGGKQLEIVASDRSVISWQDFSIAQGESTRFIQPSSSSAVLNRVISSQPSEIFGELEGNGKVFLINPNGVFVGQSGVINTASFLASTLDLPEQLFLKGGDLLFSNGGQGSIVNLGTIRAWDGDVILLSREVVNKGMVEAIGGDLHLMSAEEVLLSPQDSKVFIRINKGAKAALEEASLGNPYAQAICHQGKAHALVHRERGGRIFLVAEDRVHIDGDLTGSEIVVSGESLLLERGTLDVSGEGKGGSLFIGGGFQGKDPLITPAARTVVNQEVSLIADGKGGDGGTIVVWSEGETTFLGSASAQGGSSQGNGGVIEISGKELCYHGSASTFAPRGAMGELLFDPNDITISTAATNPSFNGTVFDGNGVAASVLNVTDLETALALNNVTIQTSSSTDGGSGDITISNDVTWNSTSNLTLTPDRDLNVNARVTCSSSGGLIVTTGRNCTVGGASLGVPAQLGSQSGALSFSVSGDLSVLGGNASGAYAHIGYDAASVSSDLTFSYVQGNLTVQGGSGQNAFALIGHGSNASVGGTKSGALAFINSVKGNVTLQGGVSSGQNAFAQIGHVRGLAGAVTTSGDLTLSGVGGALQVLGGASSGNYALLGHGGISSSYADSYSGAIDVSADTIQITGATSSDAFASLGYFAKTSAASPLSITSSLVSAQAMDSFTIQAADGGVATCGAHIQTTGSGSATATVTSIVVTSGTTDITLTADAPTTAANSVLVGASTETGTAACALALSANRDLLLTVPSTGGAAATLSIQNGSGSPVGSWNAAITAGNNMTLTAGKGGATISSIDTLSLSTSVGVLTLIGSATDSASITSANAQTINVAGNLVLTGTSGGGSAFIQGENGLMNLNGRGALTLNPNSYIQHASGSGDLYISVRTDATLTRSASSTAYFNSAGSGQASLTAGNDITVESSIIHTGSGILTLKAGRDLLVGKSTSSLPSEIGGSSSSQINLSAGRNFTVQGGGVASAYSQIGCDAATVTSPINVLNVEGVLTVQGGSAAGAFAAIGHGRYNGVGGAKGGNITIGKGIDNIYILGGTADDTYAQIGHASTSLAQSTLSGNIRATDLEGAIVVTGGTGARAFALMGHGGSTSYAGDIYSGNFSSRPTELTLTGGSNDGAFAGIGYTNNRSLTSIGDVTISSDFITTNTSGTITIQAGTGAGATAFFGADMGATTTPNALSITRIEAITTQSYVLTGSSLAADAHAVLGISNALGDAGCYLRLRSQQGVSLTGDLGNALIKNGSGTPIGSYPLVLDLGTSLTLSSGSSGETSIVGIDTLDTTCATGGLSLTASSGAASSLSSTNALTLAVYQDTTLTGVASGQTASISNANNALNLTSSSITLNPNSFIQNGGGNDAMLTLKTTTDCQVTGAAGGNSYIYNLGAGSTNFLIGQDLKIYSTIQNPGSGDLNLMITRDLILGSAVSPLRAHLGTTGIMTGSVGGNLTLTAGNGVDAFAQLGAQADTTISGDLLINFVGGNVMLTADTATNTFAQIGHRSPVPITGSISVIHINGTETLTSGGTDDTYAEIGNHTGAVIP